MNRHDRHLSDGLFEIGFEKMANGQYEEGLNTLRTAAGADQWAGSFDSYDPAVGISHVAKIAMAARGHLDSQGNYDPDRVAHPRPDPAAIVFMGAEAEFKGFIERRTGKSPDYRAHGFVNHLGQAIAHYRRAEKAGYSVAKWRLEALQLKLGTQDFYNVETSYHEAAGRAMAYTNDLRNEILGNLRRERPVEQPAKQGGCYIATAVYGDYDAPPVMTLRNFRDRTLTSSVGGRAFVAAYYALSPSLARHLEGTTLINKLARRALDRLVRHLETRGYSSDVG